jgi:hypothetical protein
MQHLLNVSLIQQLVFAPGMLTLKRTAVCPALAASLLFCTSIWCRSSIASLQAVCLPCGLQLVPAARHSWATHHQPHHKQGCAAHRAYEAYLGSASSSSSSSSGSTDEKVRQQQALVHQQLQRPLILSSSS